jgi:hypothetical protein
MTAFTDTVLRRPSSVVCPQPLLLGAVAAHFHFAPAPPVVLGGVEKASQSASTGVTVSRCVAPLDFDI